MASTINASTTSTSGLVQTADASGILQLQSNGTNALRVEANAFVTIDTTLTVSGNISTSGNISSNRLTTTGNVSIGSFLTTPAGPAFMAGIAATSNGTYTANPYAFAFNVTAFNRGNCFNTSNGRFTAPVAGIYLFGFNNYNGSNSFAQFIFRINGGDPPSFTGGDAYGVAEYPASVNQLGFTLTSMLELAAGDYVTVGVRSGSSGSFYQGHTYFFGHLVG